MADQKTVTVEQYRSAARRPEIQTQTLKGLKLNKIRRRSTLVDTPAVRGMIAKIPHLVRVVEPHADPKKPVRHVSLEKMTRAAMKANNPRHHAPAKKVSAKKDAPRT